MLVDLLWAGTGASISGTAMPSMVKCGAAGEHLAAVAGEVADSDDTFAHESHVLPRWPQGFQLNRIELSTVMGATMRLNQSA